MTTEQYQIGYEAGYSEGFDAGAAQPAGESASIEKLGKRLAELLDEDQFVECEKLLLSIGVSAQAAQPSHAHAIDTSPERVEKQGGDVQVPEGWQLVARVYSKHGDPEAFGEREIETLIDLKTIPYKTNLYAAPSTKEDV